MLKNFFILLLLALVISQFLRPDKNESSYDSITAFETQAAVTPEVQTILESQCYDCHSNVTRYPWYMEVSPVSHWMAYQIEEGKEHFNISEWETYTENQKDHKLEEFIEEIEKKEMPLKPYTWIHGELSNTDAERLISWAKQQREKPVIPEEDTANVKEIDSLQVETSNTLTTK